MPPRDCRKRCSVKTGSAREASHLPLRKWAIICPEVENVKRTAANRLRRDIEASCKTARSMLRRVREGFTDTGAPMDGPVAGDETCIGGKRKNMSRARRKELRSGRGGIGKAAVVGAKNRQARKVPCQGDGRHVIWETLHGFVRERAVGGAKVCADEAVACQGMPFDHETVQRGVGERAGHGARERH